ncbi:MAG: DNA polymerase IV [Candidatus Hydrothermae bacterium]|nr:DNA polymerase IV [Candidatus Hydrothermae bacterium]MDD5572954.1 DNA polymerase IV [Candidatus Hydrothermia bacterium]HOK22946.1 DNA polymerase IV [Candidatus Hydrothermia bacterium]HOL23794.1 DNA polymerase IV [Candidatus Hydrothermia bacterium]HPO78799.1 DNA polymerase IV [Candidatus Hydrothermia bacterium]
MNKKIMLVDMDAFFVSCEVAARPKLRGKPVGVCTGPQRGGVVASVSYEARKYGVKAGMPTFKVRDLCPGITLIPADAIKYAYISDSIMEYLKNKFEKVEIFSVDEAFIDVTNVKDPIEVGMEVKDHIKKTFHTPLTIGIGPSRVIAKMACEVSKPDGLLEIKESELLDKLGHLEVDEIPGIGERSGEALRSMGIRTVQDLWEVDEGLLTRKFGIRGKWFKDLAMGKDTGFFTLLENGAPLKSIGHSETFPRDIIDEEEIKNYTLYLCEKVGRRLRKHKVMGYGISVYIRYYDFTGNGISRKFAKPLFTTSEIYNSALFLLNQIREIKPVRLIGVSVFALAPVKIQLSIFNDDCKEVRLERTLDKINDTYGDFTVRRARLAGMQSIHHAIPPRGIPR